MKTFIVAPRVGAWIETRELQDCSTSIMVAPRVGAWIETMLTVTYPREFRRASRGRVD